MEKFCRYFTVICIAFFSTLSSYSQATLTLEDCIEIALKNNINLQISQNNARVSGSNKTQALLNFLPTLTANADYQFTNGTFWDQSAARLVSATTEQSRPWLSAQMVVFNGFSNKFNYQQTIKQLDADNYAVESSKIDLKSSIYTAYLNLILDKENIKISNQRVELLTAQLDRETKRESVGVGNMESVYNFRSQLANEKLNNVTLSNTFKRDKLLLLQLLRLDPSKEYVFELIQPSANEELLETQAFGEVLDKAKSFSPSLKQAEANYAVSKYALKSARASRYPILSASASVGSQFSSNGATDPGTGEYDLNADFFTQMDWNRQQQYGLNLRIPIFTRWSNENVIQVAKINLETAELSQTQAELDMTNSIQNVYLDLISAQETYRAAEENLVALTQSFDFIEKRYETGNTDFFTYLESLNNKNRAEIELVNAKYSIIFRKKIIGLFEGES